MKTTWKQFKQETLNSKAQFLGAINNKSMDEIKTIIDNQIDSVDKNYNRAGTVRSTFIDWNYSLEGEIHTSRLDTKGTVTFYKGVYILEGWNFILYRFEDTLIKEGL